MDFITKPLHLSRPSTISAAPLKSSRASGKTKFMPASGQSSIDDTQSIQPFTVTALDTVFLDLSSSIMPDNINYGHTLLDKLDDLKQSLLKGKFLKEELLSLQHLLKYQQMDTVDPKLKEILKEIETRVAVELAKQGL